MSTEITPDEVLKFEAERQLDAKNEPSDKMEAVKTIATLSINVITIILLAWASMNASTELSTRFMSLLEIVIGAIFGVTATQIAKEH